MADFKTITLDEDKRGVATLTLRRADKHNALNAQMISELTAAAGLIAESPSMRVIILAGEGRSFCAGGDLNWMRAQMDKPEQERIKEGMTLAAMLRALDDLPKPLIAKVQGNAFGGGVGMMCVADIVIAADHIKFALTETRLGLIPATIGPYVVRRLGEGNARRCFMNSKVFQAEDGLHLGLISRVVPASALADTVMSEAESFLSCAPGAVKDAKALAKYLARTSDDTMDYTTDRLAERWADPESSEGTRAFFEKRKPGWSVE